MRSEPRVVIRKLWALGIHWAHTDFDDPRAAGLVCDDWCDECSDVHPDLTEKGWRWVILRLRRFQMRAPVP